MLTSDYYPKFLIEKKQNTFSFRFTERENVHVLM